MESLPLFPTAYLPSVRYMAALARYEKVAVEGKETFPKQTYRNRCAIATGNGEQVLSVPVIRPNGNHTRTEEVLISYQEPWNVRHWRAIVSAYNAAPYFLYYRDDFEGLLLGHYDHLVELNKALLCLLTAKTRLSCAVVPTEDFEHPTGQEDDYRDRLCAKHARLSPTLPRYDQVFESRLGFLSDLSVIDLLFNLGPEANAYLRRLAR